MRPCIAFSGSRRVFRRCSSLSLLIWLRFLTLLLARRRCRRGACGRLRRVSLSYRKRTEQANSEAAGRNDRPATSKVHKSLLVPLLSVPQQYPQAFALLQGYGCSPSRFHLLPPKIKRPPAGGPYISIRDD